MTEFRFIHCSDLHLDTPFSGLADIPEALQSRLHESTFRAWQNIVELAIAERVDAVLIAGDVYDAEDKSLRAQFQFRDGLQRLAGAGIASFIAHGNHDPLNERAGAIRLPDAAAVFPAGRVEAYPVRRDGQALAHVYGASFGRREVRDNLARLFKNGRLPGFAVGLLHANVGGNTGHGDYAPCGMDDLVAAGMDYWALGHVHSRRVLREQSPAIVYCGNTQSRHFREPGEKGCCLVTLRPGLPPEIRFVATDAARHHRDTLDISRCGHIDDVVSALREKMGHLRAQAGERPALLRVSLTGRSPLHAELRKGGVADGLRGEALRSCHAGGPGFWLELDLETAGDYDLDALRQGNDFFADITGLYDAAETDAAQMEELRRELAILLEQWEGQGCLAQLPAEEWRALLHKARDLTLDHLLGAR